MENDAISRSAVLEDVESIDWYRVTRDGRLVRGSTSDVVSYVKYSDVVHALKNAPALDVAPVVHARWVPSWEPLDLSDVYFRCSACHTNFNVGTEIDMEMAKYCPKCGARMDGETDVV